MRARRAGPSGCAGQARRIRCSSQIMEKPGRMSARKIIARSLPRVPEACKQAGWRRRGRPQVLGGMALALLLAGCQTPEAPRHQAAFARDGGDTGKAVRHVIVMINNGAGWWIVHRLRF